MAGGGTVTDAPGELLEIILLERFSGYTRESLQGEDAGFVRRMIAYLQAEAVVAKREAEKRGRRRGA